MTGTLHQHLCTSIYDNISLISSWNERNCADKNTEKTKAHFILNNFFPESRTVYETKWKRYCKARQATNDKTTCVRCVLQN